MLRNLAFDSASINLEIDSFLLVKMRKIFKIKS